jgi:hypothetical protein
LFKFKFNSPFDGIISHHDHSKSVRNLQRSEIQFSWDKKFDLSDFVRLRQTSSDRKKSFEHWYFLDVILRAFWISGVNCRF